MKLTHYILTTDISVECPQGEYRSSEMTVCEFCDPGKEPSSAQGPCGKCGSHTGVVARWSLVKLAKLFVDFHVLMVNHDHFLFPICKSFKSLTPTFHFGCCPMVTCTCILFISVACPDGKYRSADMSGVCSGCASSNMIPTPDKTKCGR